MNTVDKVGGNAQNQYCKRFVVPRKFLLECSFLNEKTLPYGGFSKIKSNQVVESIMVLVDKMTNDDCKNENGMVNKMVVGIGKTTWF